jgi:uncharacterized protein
MDFEYSWDDQKASSNLRKHGVSFEEASSIFNDPLALTQTDNEHSNLEQRFITFGKSLQNRILTVSHTEINLGIRIISARKADKFERKFYEQG